MCRFIYFRFSPTIYIYIYVCVCVTFFNYIHSGVLTHWGRVTHKCGGKLTRIGSDNGLSPGRRQAIIWTNAGILLIGPLGTKFSEILIAIEAFSFKKIHLKISSAKLRPFCLGLNVLSNIIEAVKCAFTLLFCRVNNNVTGDRYNTIHYNYFHYSIIISFILF